MSKFQVRFRATYVMFAPPIGLLSCSPARLIQRTECASPDAHMDRIRLGCFVSTTGPSPDAHNRLIRRGNPLPDFVRNGGILCVRLIT